MCLYDPERFGPPPRQIPQPFRIHFAQRLEAVVEAGAFAKKVLCGYQKGPDVRTEGKNAYPKDESMSTHGIATSFLHRVQISNVCSSLP